MKTKPQKPWTTWRNEHLRKNYKELEMPNLVDLFGVSKGAIRRKAFRLGVQKHRKKPWSPAEEQELLSFGYPITTQVARLFGRTPGAVRDKLRELLHAEKASKQTPK